MLSLMQKVELLKQIAANPNIPSPPTVILRVLEKASARDCTVADLCKVIRMDAGLSGKILRIVNSALFGLSRPVTSIDQALRVVGVNSARLLVLSIALPEMSQKSKLAGPVVQRYWKSSISGAIVAHGLAQHCRASDAEDEMATALLRDIGELILQQVFPDSTEKIALQPEQLGVDAQCDREEAHYGLHHAEVSAFILDRWRLPTDMTEAVRWHHAPAHGRFSTPAAERRAFTLHFATRAAQLVLSPNQPLVFRELYQLGKEHFRMNESDVLAFLGPLNQKASDFAALLQVDMGEAGDFSDALLRAGEELVHLSLAVSLDHQRAQEQTQRLQTEAQRWREEAIFDPLTKLFNRRFLESRLHEWFPATKQDGRPFGLLFIDLDGFKPLNDRFGHAFGDVVLQRVAVSLQREVRREDIVARHGGDEFCILADAMDEIGMQALGRRVLAGINSLLIRHGGNEGCVGASIGAVCCSPRYVWATPQDLLAGADRAMYQAKAQGKNRVVFMKSMSAAGAETAAPAGRDASSNPIPESGYSQ
jgi:diguanylate cyclase (GGDEF)-like protein